MVMVFARSFVLLCGLTTRDSSVRVFVTVLLFVPHWRSPHQHLVHVVAVLSLINQKGLNVQCRKLARAIDELAGTLENLEKTIGAKGTVPKDEMESCKLGIGQTQEMLQEAQKAHDKAIAKTYKLLRNLLSSDA
jgi:hypothetical protein